MSTKAKKKPSRFNLVVGECMKELAPKGTNPDNRKAIFADVTKMVSSALAGKPALGIPAAVRLVVGGLRRGGFGTLRGLRLGTGLGAGPMGGRQDQDTSGGN